MAPILFNASTGSISSGLTDVGTIVTECVNWITNNAILFTMFVGGLVPVGFMVIRKAKKAAKA